MKVAFLTAACMLPGHRDLREDHWEHDLEFKPLHSACAERGIDLKAVIWDDPNLDIGSFAAFVIGTTWDYAEKPAQYLATLQRIASHRLLLNPLEVVRWNIRKTYLRDLADRGAPVVPTLWRDKADEATIARAFDELGTEEIVVKPVVGASAWRQARLKRGDSLPTPDELPPDETMIQPFLHAAANEGEFSFLFFDRRFSHCARKIPRDGDYRVQSMYGGREEGYRPSAVELQSAVRILDAVDLPLLYARVDMMRGLDGELALMELELIEPYLYPDQGPDIGDHFAQAFVRLMSK